MPLPNMEDKLHTYFYNFLKTRFIFIYLSLPTLYVNAPHACSTHEGQEKTLGVGVTDTSQLPCGHWL